jgi:pSer/pThr/pTyr-binding forkhead associated (FHA) protein
MPNPPALTIELALKGRSIRKYSFAKERVTIGRDPGADVVLDNMGVSRAHALIELIDGTYVIRDEGSSNGTFVNGERTDRLRLGDRDVVNIGKFSLLVGIAAGAGDARAAARQAADDTADEMEGTMVLTSDQLARVLKRGPETQPVHQPVLGIVEGAPDPKGRAAGAVPVLPWILAVVGALLVGLAIGAAVF